METEYFTITPDHGESGETSITILPHTPNTGRTERIEEHIVKTQTEPSISKKIIIKQEALAEFVSFNNIEEIIINSQGGELPIYGLTNSASLTFSLDDDALNLTLPETYNAGGSTAINGQPIAGDPGARNAFRFSIILNIAENTTTEYLHTKLTVTAHNNQSVCLIITQKIK